MSFMFWAVLRLSRCHQLQRSPDKTDCLIHGTGKLLISHNNDLRILNLRMKLIRATQLHSNNHRNGTGSSILPQSGANTETASCPPPFIVPHLPPLNRKGTEELINVMNVKRTSKM